MKKILTIIVAVATISVAAKASGPFLGSSVEFGARFGIGALLPVSDPAIADFMPVKYTPSIAAGIDMHYTYMANQFFGFTTGMSFIILNSSMSSSGVRSTYTGDMMLDLPGFGVTASGVHCVGTTSTVKESYKTAFVEIPALLAIRNGNWYYDLGLRFAVPLKMNADYEYGQSIMYIDYVERTGSDLSANPMPQPADIGGKGEYNVLSNRSRSLYVLWSMEIGYTIDLFANGALSIGAYLDYGLNDANLGNKETDELLTLNGSTVAGYNGMTNSNLMSSIRYYTAGVRVLYNLGFGSKVGGKRSKSLL